MMEQYSYVSHAFDSARQSETGMGTIRSGAFCTGGVQGTATHGSFFTKDRLPSAADGTVP